MSRQRKKEAALAANVFQFTLAGLIIFSLTLIAAASFITAKLAAANHSKRGEVFAVDPDDKTRAVHSGPWGDLVTRDIELERPVEYLTGEVSDPQPEVWTFNGLKPDAVNALFAKDGLTPAQVAAAFAPGCFKETASGTELRPSEAFLLSLDADARRKLYIPMAGLGVNTYFDFPFIFPGDEIESIYHDASLNPDDLALFKRLVYSNGAAKQLSDYPFLLGKIPTLDRRIAMAQSLSRESAVIAGLSIRPDTDIDKIAAYWGNMPNVHFTDIRPMMEALKALPQGGYLSLVYLLPKFARERLYTFPMPPKPGDPVMDCHWTTFNFASDTPDNRFNDTTFAAQFIESNYYRIAAPSQYGDILLLMNDRQEIKHSAVYLADDLVFTKNGNNYRQPWMIMRIPDLLATYPARPPMKAIYMRLKTN
jgi:hypothetical protein